MMAEPAEPLTLHISSNGYPEQVSAGAALGPEVPASPTGLSPTSAKALRLRGRTRRKKPNQRVTWDEKAIAEHDKERGTRQKIDEPDTPFIRSPQTASDSEGGGPLSSDDEQRRLSIRLPIHIPGLEAEKQNPRGADSKRHPPEEHAFSAGAIADRLNDWVLNGELQRGRRAGDVSSSGDEEKMSRTSTGGGSENSCNAGPGGRRRSGERRISLSEDSPAPKPSSDNFKAKRMNHYNEVAAMRAFKQKGGPVLSDPESDTSDEENADGTILTNTNTNKNMNPGGRKRLDSGESGSAAGSFSAADAPSGNDAPASSGSVLGSDAPATAAGQDGADREDAARGSSAPATSVASTSQSAPTVDASPAPDSACSAGTAGAASTGGPRGSGVLFGSAEAETQADVGQKKKMSPEQEAAWKAKRNAHYNEMARALRAQPPVSDEESDTSSGED